MPRTVRCLVLSALLAVLVRPLLAQESPAPEVPGAPPPAAGGGDLSSLTEEKAALATAAWPKFTAWVQKNEAQRQAYDQAMQGKDEKAAPGAFMQLAAGFAGAADFEANVGMKAQDFSAILYAMMLAYTNLVVKDEITKMEAEIQKLRAEAQSATDPSTAAALNQQAGAMDQGVAELRRSFASTPPAALNIAEKHRKDIEAWMKWSPGGSSPAPGESPSAEPEPAESERPRVQDVDKENDQ